jgi:hypothetical protein
LSEKRKWFDRKPSPQVPMPVPRPMVISVALTRDGIDEFIREIDPTKNKKIKEDTYKLFSNLAGMSHASRLARNLKVLLGILAVRSVDSITSDGVTDEEKSSLVNLEVTGASQFCKEVAQSLLNVAERYQVLQSVGDTFRQSRELRN